LSRIHVSTLGRLVIRDEDRELAQLPAQRLRCALLVYLAVERRATREQILSLLWPDRDPDRARHSLSQTLYELRTTLDGDWVESRGDLMSVDDDVTADVVEFEEAVKKEAWSRAVEIYRGRFLDSIYLVDTREFEGWVDRLQGRLSRLFRQALGEAVGESRAAGNLEKALRLARRGVELDPLDDESQHQLVLLLAESGQRSAALKQYERYEQLLRDELDVEPLDQTMKLVRRIRKGRLDESGGALLGEPRMEGGKVIEGSPEDAAEEDDAPPDLIPAVGRGSFLGQRAGSGSQIRLASLLQRSTFVAVGVGIFVVVLVGFLWLSGSAREATDTGTQPSESSGLSPSRIAVLYFDDHSADRSMGGLADGITETLIHELAQVPGLDVVPRNGSRIFREREAIPWDSVASVLGAGTVIEGSVDGSEGSARIAIRLVNAATQQQLESALLQLPTENRFALLDSVAGRVAGLVQRTVGLEVRLDELRAGTSVEEALELVQSAESEQRTAEALSDDGALPEAEAALSRADSLLVLASELDEDWEQPLILRGWGSLQLAGVEEERSFDPSIASTGPAPHLEAARRFARTALEIAPDSPEALELSGVAAFRTWRAGLARDSAAMQVTTAERDLRAAIRSDESLARAHATLSALLRETGHFEEALIHAEDALSHDRFLDNAADLTFQLGQTLLDLGRPEEAGEWLEEGRRRFPDDRGFISGQLTLLMLPTGSTPDVDRAWELAREMERLTPPPSRPANAAYGRMQVAAILARAGRPDSALAVVSRLEASGLADSGGPGVLYLKSIVWLHLGQRDSALANLERFLEESPQMEAYIPEDWAFEPLWDDPGFQELVADSAGV